MIKAEKLKYNLSEVLVINVGMSDIITGSEALGDDDDELPDMEPED